MYSVFKAFKQSETTVMLLTYRLQPDRIHTSIYHMPYDSLLLFPLDFARLLLGFKVSTWQ